MARRNFPHYLSFWSPYVVTFLVGSANYFSHIHLKVLGKDFIWLYFFKVRYFW